MEVTLINKSTRENLGTGSISGLGEVGGFIELSDIVFAELENVIECGEISGTLTDDDGTEYDFLVKEID